LQEEYGGAGNFHIPVEEHYMLEKEEWRYDKYPEFYNGSNVMDFYDPDITAKLNELEREEEELLKMENLQDEVMEEPENGITISELMTSLKQVRGKKALAKLDHKLKQSTLVHKRQHNITDMIEGLKSKGIDVNEESMRARAKTRKTIKEIEAGKDKLAKNVLADSDDSDVVSDDEMAANEA
jgi:nucleolar GTP-binding protein